jgi:hypothetical protein
MQAKDNNRPPQRLIPLKPFYQTYGIGRTKALEEIKSGRLRALKCGNRTLIAIEDAEAWARSLPVIVRESV